jgi:CheY-like chemotaxis protein
MLAVLICSPRSLETELGGTVLWGNNVDRRLARDRDQARLLAAQGRPDIIVVDQDMPGAAALVNAFRENPYTRRISIVVLARGDFDPSELELLQSGANAILRIPPGVDWDDRLVRLMHIPQRRQTTFGVYLRLDVEFAEGGETFPAQALNLSVNGILVESSRPLQVGDELHYAFQLPGDPTLIDGSGTVVRHGAEPLHYGVELTHVDGDGRVRIKKFVEAEGSTAGGR